MIYFINFPVANLYAWPHANAPVVTQALYGWKVKLLEERFLFKKIQTEDGYRGWILAKHLLPKLSIHSSKPACMAKTIHQAVHIYQVPDLTKQRPILTLPFEVFLEVVSEPEVDNFRWIQVKLMDDRLAWVHRSNVQLNPAFWGLADLIKLSRQFLGLPYTWGGTSSFGYDCSGFIQMLFRQMGLILPRDARQQINHCMCQSVELAHVQEGDLIFFGPSSAKVTHVGLYLGHQEIIHATARDIPVLQITSLQDQSLEQRYTYRAARRVVTIQSKQPTLGLLIH